MTLDEQRTVIDQLNLELEQTRERLIQTDTKNEKYNFEVNEYKSRVQQLNEQILKVSTEKDEIISENWQQQKQYETHVEKIKKDMQIVIDNFTKETEANHLKHHHEFKVITHSHSNCYQTLFYVTILIFLYRNKKRNGRLSYISFTLSARDR